MEADKEQKERMMTEKKTKEGNRQKLNNWLNKITAKKPLCSEQGILLAPTIIPLWYVWIPQYTMQAWFSMYVLNPTVHNGSVVLYVCWLHVHTAPEPALRDCSLWILMSCEGSGSTGTCVWGTHCSDWLPGTWKPHPLRWQAQREMESEIGKIFCFTN